MAQETLYTGNLGMVTILTANSNLDGTTGSYGTVITASSGSSLGTLVKTITIKAQTDTSQGMVRFFVTGGGSTRLILEVPVPAVTKSATDKSFLKTIRLNFKLSPGYVIIASTEIGNTFNIIAEGLDWKYNPTVSRTDTTILTSKGQYNTVSTANSSLTGSGTLVQIIVAANSVSGSYGCQVNSITVKAIQNTTSGMIRLFIQNSGGTTTVLLAEIKVPAITKSYAAPSFYYTLYFNDSYYIPAGYKILASTEKGETFIAHAECYDWKYAS